MVAGAELHKVSWIHGCILSLSTSHIEHKILTKKKRKKENKIHKITHSFVMGRWFHFPCFEAKNPLAFSAVSALFVCSTRPFDFFHNSSPFSLQTTSPISLCCLGWNTGPLLCYGNAPLISHISSLKSYIWSDIFVSLLV